MTETMREIGIWYFNTGWIITTILSLPVGYLAGKLRRPWMLWAWCVFVFIVGGFMLYAKHA